MRVNIVEKCQYLASKVFKYGILKKKADNIKETRRTCNF